MPGAKDSLEVIRVVELTVKEPRGCAFSEYLMEILKAQPAEEMRESCVLVKKSGDPERFGIVVALCADTTPVKKAAVIFGPAAAQDDADCLISCGLSPKETLTVSSYSDDTLVIALQRAVRTLYGQEILPQEYVCEMRRVDRTAYALLAAATLLALGRSPADQSF